jgi:hypothetical protein
VLAIVIVLTGLTVGAAGFNPGRSSLIGGSTTRCPVPCRQRLRQWSPRPPSRHHRFVFAKYPYVGLCKLKANQGNQNYEIPDEADLKKFTSVSIWCKRFRVPLALQSSISQTAVTPDQFDRLCGST